MPIYLLLFRRPERFMSCDGYFTAPPAQSLPGRAAPVGNAPYPKHLSKSEVSINKPKSILKKNSSYSNSTFTVNGESDSLSSSSSYNEALLQQQQKQAMIARLQMAPPLHNAAILAAVGAEQQRMTSPPAHGQQRQTGRRGARPVGPRARTDVR